MVHNANKISIYQNIFLLVLGSILMLDRIYTPSGEVTGIYNPIIFPLLIIALLLYILSMNLKLSLNAAFITIIAIVALFTSFLLLDGNLMETLRYFLYILLIFFAKQIKPFKLTVLIRTIIIVGSAFTLYDILINLKRSVGFLASSPTLYSLVILIAVTYLIYLPEKKLLDNILVLIGIFLIWSTGSRSTLFVSMVFYVIKNLNYFFVRKNVLIRYLGFILTIIVVFSSIFVVIQVLSGELVLREGSYASTLTRIGFIKRILEYLYSKPGSIFYGLGPGFSYYFTSSYTNIKIPLHQDFLTILCDFGILGIVITFSLLLSSKYRWSWHGWLLLLVASLHNLIYFPIGFILISLTSSLIYHTYHNITEENSQE